MPLALDPSFKSPNSTEPDHVVGQSRSDSPNKTRLLAIRHEQRLPRPDALIRSKSRYERKAPRSEQQDG